jgi:leukotriene-A4 hydrolase
MRRLQADKDSFVAAAEEFTSPYRFGVYDLLILPESFPYGGKLLE